MNYITYFFLRIEDEILKKIRCVRFYQTRYGIKNFGASKLVGTKQYQGGTTIELPADKLFLGPDFLNDDFTLLDCPISCSPHYKLMEAIRDNKSLRETEYMKRFTNGCLDWRRGKPIPQNLDYYYSKNRASLDGIIKGDYRRVIIYKQGVKYYIYDGKHRAAMCALLELPVKCILVGSEVANADLWHYLFSMCYKKPNYRKHADFHKVYLDTIDR